MMFRLIAAHGMGETDRLIAPTLDASNAATPQFLATASLRRTVSWRCLCRHDGGRKV